MCRPGRLSLFTAFQFCTEGEHSICIQGFALERAVHVMDERNRHRAVPVVRPVVIRRVAVPATTSSAWANFQ